MLSPSVEKGRRTTWSVTAYSAAAASVFMRAGSITLQKMTGWQPNSWKWEYMNSQIG